MRIALLALAALAATPAAASAQTDQVHDYAPSAAVALVRETCVPQHANAATIAADLQARGWRQLSEAERAQRDPESVAQGFVMHWTNAQTWAPPDNPVRMLMLGDGPVGEGVRADFCMVYDRMSFPQQTIMTRRWLGFRRFQTWGPGGDIYAYQRDGEGNISNAAELSDEDSAAAMREGRYGFIQVVGNNTRSVVNFSVLHPAE